MPAPHNRHNGGPPLDGENPFGRDGWIAVARVMREHHLVGFGRPVDPADPERGFTYSRAEAWLDLIMECRYAAGTVMNGGKRMDLLPGQLLGATSWLANRWNWTPKTVRGFLEKLQSDGMIERSTPGIQYTKSQVHPGSDEIHDVHVVGRPKGTQAQVITIRNYSTYQIIRDEEGHAQGHAEGTQGARQGHAKGNTLTKEQGNTGTQEQETKQQASTAPVAASGGLAGPQDIVSIMVPDIVSWMSSGADEHNARQWIKTTIAGTVNGGQILYEAYGKLKTDLATGSASTMPLKTLFAIFNRMRSETASKPRQVISKTPAYLQRY